MVSRKGEHSLLFTALFQKEKRHEKCCLGLHKRGILEPESRNTSATVRVTLEDNIATSSNEKQM